MKHYFLTIPILVAVLVSATITGCNKTNETSVKTNSVGNAAQKPGTGAVNYCKGCGEEPDSKHYCGNGYCLHYLVDPPLCPAGKVLQLCEDNSLMDSVDTAECYNVRDNFLVKTEKGQWYHTYYYAFGKIALDNDLINLSNIGDYLKMYHQTLDVAHIVWHGNGNEIPVNAEYRNRALAFISEYSKHTNNTTDLSYLNQVASDLNEFEGKTVTYIRDAIK